MTVDDPFENHQEHDQEPSQDPSKAKERLIKQLAAVVCICKGIPLSKFLPVLDACQSVEDVNDRTGAGSGGCAGERCGPRIKILLRKKQKSKN